MATYNLTGTTGDGFNSLGVISPVDTLNFTVYGSTFVDSPPIFTQLSGTGNLSITQQGVGITIPEEGTVTEIIGNGSNGSSWSLTFTQYNGIGEPEIVSWSGTVSITPPDRFITFTTSFEVAVGNTSGVTVALSGTTSSTLYRIYDGSTRLQTTSGGSGASLFIPDAYLPSIAGTSKTYDITCVQPTYNGGNGIEIAADGFISPAQVTVTRVQDEGYISPSSFSLIEGGSSTSVNFVITTNVTNSYEWQITRDDPSTSYGDFVGATLGSFTGSSGSATITLADNETTPLSEVGEQGESFTITLSNSAGLVLDTSSFVVYDNDSPIVSALNRTITAGATTFNAAWSVASSGSSPIPHRIKKQDGTLARSTFNVTSYNTTGANQSIPVNCSITDVPAGQTRTYTIEASPDGGSTWLSGSAFTVSRGNYVDPDLNVDLYRRTVQATDTSAVFNLLSATNGETYKAVRYGTTTALDTITNYNSSTNYQFTLTGSELPAEGETFWYQVYSLRPTTLDGNGSYYLATDADNAFIWRRLADLSLFTGNNEASYVQNVTQSVTVTNNSTATPSSIRTSKSANGGVTWTKDDGSAGEDVTAWVSNPTVASAVFTTPRGVPYSFRVRLYKNGSGGTNPATNDQLATASDYFIFNRNFAYLAPKVTNIGHTVSNISPTSHTLTLSGTDGYSQYRVYTGGYGQTLVGGPITGNGSATITGSVGTYYITAILPETNGGDPNASAQNVKVYLIGNTVPSINYFTASPSSAIGGTTVTLSASATDPDTTISSMVITAVAGTPVTLSSPTTTGIGTPNATVSRTFTAPNTAGTTTFNVTVTDSSNAANSASVIFTSTGAGDVITNFVPQFSTYKEGADSSVNFSFSVSNPTQSSYYWRLSRAGGTNEGEFSASTGTVSVSNPNFSFAITNNSIDETGTYVLVSTGQVVQGDRFVAQLWKDSSLSEVVATSTQFILYDDDLQFAIGDILPSNPVPYDYTGNVDVTVINNGQGGRQPNSVIYNLTTQAVAYSIDDLPANGGGASEIYTLNIGNNDNIPGPGETHNYELRVWNGQELLSGPQFSITKAPPVTEPDQFELGGPVENAVQNLPFYSNEITVSGIQSSTSISVSGTGSPAYSINTGAYTSAPGSVNNGDKVVLRVYSGASENQTTVGELDIGGRTDTFSVTTATAGTGGGTIPSTPADYGIEIYNASGTKTVLSPATRYGTVVAEDNFILEKNGQTGDNHLVSVAEMSELTTSNSGIILKSVSASIVFTINREAGGFRITNNNPDASYNVTGVVVRY